MKRTFLILITFIPLFAFGQKRGSVWCFGDSALVNFSDTSNIIVGHSSVKSRGSCVSISDSSGQLLFYAYTRAGVAGNSAKIINSDDSVMQNGNSIVGEGWYHELVIIPTPGSDSLYYIFSIGVTGSSQSGLYYSIVDMSAIGGLGKVIQKNVQLKNFKCSDGLTAIKHGNGRDWWLIFRRWDTVNDKFYKYLITPSGISNSMSQNIGTATDNGFGRIQFSNNGTKMLFYDYRGLMELYDFDRCTGHLSNTNTIYSENAQWPWKRYWSAQFSPNDSILYVTNIPEQISDTSRLYQFDLTAANIAASADTLRETMFMETQDDLKLAPDGKIYLATSYTQIFPYSDTTYNNINMHLSTINSPDSLGAACDLQPYSFHLGGSRTYGGLPNNPDYDMPPLYGSACDSLSICNPPATGLKTVNITSTTAQLKWKKYPNAIGYKIRYKQPGLTWKYKTVFNNIGSKVISNLIPGKKYRWGIATICAPGDTSAYSVTRYFTTAAIRETVYNPEPAQPITELTVHPNPAKDLLYVHFNSGNEEATIKLIDLTGKTIMTKTLAAADDEFNCNVNLSSLSPGLYCLIVYSGDDVITKKVIKE